MANILQWWQRHRPTTRRLAQLYCALLYNAQIKGFITGDIYTGKLKAVCTPGLNCYSCPGAVGACPLGALQNAVAASGTRAGTYALGILMLFGLLLGRTICGWLCPFGMIQELLHEIPTFKIKKSRLTRALSYIKYGILIVFVLFLPLYYGLAKGLPLPGFCKYICPAGTLEGAVGLLSSPSNTGLFPMLGALFTRKYVIMIIIGLGCIFCYRAFCRFLCPLGAIYGLFSRISLLGIQVEASRCTGCGACVRRCPMDVKYVGDHECIHCGQCKSACAANAISFKHDAAGKYRHALQIASLVLLAFVILLVNVLSPESSASVPGQPSDAPIGYEIGQQLPDFSVETLNDGTFTLSAYRGHPVLINLWATYCAPCVKELDYFSRLQTEHPEIRILAVHSSLTTEDVADYLTSHDWALAFAVDTEDDAVFRAVGGSSVLPQTIVLNATGEVVYNQVGSVTYEKLLSLLSEAN